MATSPPVFYADDAVTLRHGDAADLLASLPDGSASLTITDPPYNEVDRRLSGGEWDYEVGGADTLPVDVEWLSAELSRVTDGPIYVWCGFQQMSTFVACFEALGRPTRVGVWKKTNPQRYNSDKLWASGVELCVFAHAHNAYFDRRGQLPVWEGPTPSSHSDRHPTQKPLWLMKELVSASCAPGGTVLDPYAGSGTTLRAAADLGRKAVGCEISEDYCRIAARRLAQQTLDLEAS